MFYFIWVWEEIYVRTSVHAYIHFDLLKRVLIALIRNFLKYDFRSIFYLLSFINFASISMSYSQ